MANRRCLLVVDNCEHLLDECALVVDRILTGCPDVHVLATSREPLEVEGERVHRVPSLSVPDEGADGADIADSDAVRLFLERATGVDDRFELTDENVEAVAKICRRLDGIPLAIELAAARSAHLTPSDIAQRLDDRFRLLSGGRRRVRRQETLEATLDWSHDLLEEDERRLLRRLGVFPGSFDLALAERVGSGEGVEVDAVVDLLGSLVRKSLITAERTDNQVRYRLLETVRSYAERKLYQADEADTYRSRHRDAYLAWLESFSWEQHSMDDGTFEAVVPELHNIRSALRWSREQGRRDLVGRLAGRLPNFWQPGEGHGEEGMQWLAWVLEEPSGLDPATQAACHLGLASAAMTLGLADYDEHAARAAELGKDSLGGALAIAHGMHALGAAVRFVETNDPHDAARARAIGRDGLRRARRVPADRGWRPACSSSPRSRSCSVIWPPPSASSPTRSMPVPCPHRSTTSRAPSSPAAAPCSAIPPARSTPQPGRSMPVRPRSDPDQPCGWLLRSHHLRQAHRQLERREARAARDEGRAWTQAEAWNAVRALIDALVSPRE